MYKFGIKIKNYKCFDEESGFDQIERVNIIIGRNNSGKSSLLDLIHAVISENYNFDQSTWKNRTFPEVIFEAEVNRETVNRTFPNATGGRHISYSHRVYGEKFIKKNIKWSVHNVNQGNKFTTISCEDNSIQPQITEISDYSESLAKNMPNPFRGKIFKRLQAERDILPEKAQSNDIGISSNGRGLTNAIQCFINKSNLPSHLVEIDLLKGLNEIFARDAIFKDIVCQLHEDEKWEIFLEEETKGRVALSQSGSGLKTVILVLSFLILLPKLEQKTLSQYIFGFEELENNIHPSLLRRLNQYIHKLSEKNNFIYFLTTHSNVLIDQFSTRKDAQIIHVTHQNGVSRCVTAQTYVKKNGILDDLDIRASDILQANGVIWVEGPSDRIYLNKWIELWSNNKFSEGSHYQIVFYGGRLLSHLSAEAPEKTIGNGISILSANRNAIILIDSDKRSTKSRINTTKKRIREEFISNQSLCWITKGKEIENYLPKEAINTLLGTNISNDVQPFENFFDYLDAAKSKVGEKFSKKKTQLAEEVIQHLEKEHLERILDLDTQMKKVCETIKSWNS